MRGTRRRIIRGQPHAWPKPISMPRIIRSAIRKTGSDAVAVAADAPERYAASRWNADYALATSAAETYSLSWTRLTMRLRPRVRRTAWTEVRRRPGGNESEMTGAGRGGKTVPLGYQEPISCDT